MFYYLYKYTSCILMYLSVITYSNMVILSYNNGLVYHNLIASEINILCQVSVNVALRVSHNLINNILDHINLVYSYIIVNDKFNIVFHLLVQLLNTFEDSFLQIFIVVPTSFSEKKKLCKSNEKRGRSRALKILSIFGNLNSEK